MEGLTFVLSCAVIGLYTAAGVLTFQLNQIFTWDSRRGANLCWSIVWPVLWLIVIVLSFIDWLRGRN
jgi:hypothetical protein